MQMVRETEKLYCFRFILWFTNHDKLFTVIHGGLFVLVLYSLLVVCIHKSKEVPDFSDFYHHTTSAAILLLPNLLLKAGGALQGKR